MITIDFETRGIDGNPIVYPPQAVGMAVLVDGHPPVYLGWGHTLGNNCTYQEGLEYYKKLIASGEPLLYHNAWSFDIPVELRWMAGEIPHWDRIHDTLYLLYLHNPYAESLSLKPSAHEILGIPPESQDNLQEIVRRNAGRDLGRGWMGEAWRYTSASEMEEYALDDVKKTRALYDALIDRVPSEPYNRERKLAPLLRDATQRGIRIDRERLEADLTHYEGIKERLENDLREELQAPSLDFGKSAQLADALESAGKIGEWVLTPTGKRSTSKDNLLKAVSDPTIVDRLVYRSSVNTCLTTFMRPWLEKSAEDGRVHPNWNAVRSTEGKRKGTRTGRLSSDDPNFQNVPTEFEIVLPEGFPHPPYMRLYCLPEEGHVWIKRDWSSQEFRIVAHFEDGSICEAYIADPYFDPHNEGKIFIQTATGVEYPRKDVKITGFSIIYGSGIPGLSAQLKRPGHEAAHIRSAYFRAFPGIEELMQEIQRVGRAGQPIRTWGGRIYYVEPPKVVRGRMRSFEYKLLNYLIQGSAADQGKQTTIDWHEEKDPDTLFLAAVHDELNASAPKENVDREMKVLRRCMERDYFDVPMRSEGFVGPNWHEIVKVEE
jgi:DNA polymerase I-like protein with 3'-5' exonuclease and polymerase domains